MSPSLAKQSVVSLLNAAESDNNRKLQRMSDLASLGDDYHSLQREVVKKLIEDSARPSARVSVVPRMDDYEADKSRCLTVVAFPPVELRERIETAVIRPLMEAHPEHFYYRTESLHVTIKNIRKIADPPNFGSREIAVVQNILDSIVPAIPEFRLVFQDLVPFKNSAAMIGYSDRTLGDLIHQIDSALRSAGVTDDKKYISDTVFFGSMTICRFRSPPSEAFFELLSRISTCLEEQFHVGPLSLVTCNSVCATNSREILGSYSLCEAD